MLESWHWDFDEEIYVFKLKKGLKFHSGRLVNSRDIEFSFARWFLTDKPSFERNYVPNIVGIDKLKPGTKFKSGMVDGIKILDDLTLTIKLDVFNPTFLHSLIDVPLVPIEALQEDYYHWKGLPVGAGPYKVDSFDKEKGLFSLSKFEKDSQGPALLSIYVKQDKNLVYDIATIPPHNLTNYNKIVLSGKFDWVGQILFNYNSEISNDINFRKALQFGIDGVKIGKTREDDVLPTNEIIPTNFWGSSEYKPIYDLKKAQKYFQMIPEKLRNKKYKVYGYVEKRTEYASEIERQLRLIGLDIDVIGGWTKFTNSDPDFPIRIVTRNVSSPDPLLQFSYFMENSPLPETRPVWDKRFPVLYNRVAASKSFDVKVKSLNELSQHFLEQVISVPTFANPPVIFVKKESKIDIGQQRSGVNFFVDRIENP
ncbi:MAG: hypothetical protein HRU19_23810 [Pseudobacteriovorax sp.]|nr:hypothetical protein [Pseudobacteriovorax sp.]